MTPFQKYLSYVYRIVVEETSSEFNPQLTVAIQEGKYVLNANNANYSFATLHRVFQQALKQIDLKNVKSILVLGCGAGSIPTIIYKELGLNPKIDAVEVDEKVVELGNKYFALNQHSNLQVVIDEAMNFVKTTDNKYDLILIDLFKEITVPQEFLSQYFFELLKTLLNNDGELILNYVAYNHETKEQVKEIEKVFKKSFLKKVRTHRFEDINRIFIMKK